MRYNIEKRPDGWAVIDEDSGAVAVINDVPQECMDMEDADDLVDLLNRVEGDRPARLN